jgi:hypothetical protein
LLLSFLSLLQAIISTRSNTAASEEEKNFMLLFF